MVSIELTHDQAKHLEDLLLTMIKSMNSVNEIHKCGCLDEKMDYRKVVQICTAVNKASPK
jgi:hypothetical protein